jgi:hypothetical protein
MFLEVTKDKSDVMKGARCFMNALDAINWKVSYLVPGLFYFDGSNLNGNSNEYNKLKESHQEGCKDKSIG